MSTQSTALEELIELLAPERIAEDVFRGRCPRERVRQVYGGQVAGQALAAAGATVPAGRTVHSLHAYFVRPGDPAEPVLYDVTRLGDGHAATTRSVSAVQHDQVIFTLSASFHRAEAGLTHQDPMPQVPDPESLATYEERLAEAFGGPVAPLRQPFDLRFVGPLSFDVMRDPALRADRNLVWLRTDGTLPEAAPADAVLPDAALPDDPLLAGPPPVDPRSVAPRSSGPSSRTPPYAGPSCGGGARPAAAAPLLHEILLTYISDITLLDTVALFHGLSWGRGLTSGVSLDHAMWFHQPFRADQWLLYAQETPVAHGGRGLVRGQVFTRDGRLVASVAQEGLIRVPRSGRTRRTGPPAT
ncbi:acyl-CoA thioesterase II [Streptomyces sp. MST-110588]|uniref:acyl-CoA thioesterase n=1 Tax=Streptomyces sp. MST-110588 TaxID=2833628 RepID=UPI001F5D0258|nr:acyl-CoA thioesterase II [Streptomyces sp. MST-110588]